MPLPATNPAVAVTHTAAAVTPAAVSITPAAVSVIQTAASVIRRPSRSAPESEGYRLSSLSTLISPPESNTSKTAPQRGVGLRRCRLPALPAFSYGPLATGDWELATGSWQLSTASRLMLTNAALATTNAGTNTGRTLLARTNAALVVTNDLPRIQSSSRSYIRMLHSTPRITHSYARRNCPVPNHLAGTPAVVELVNTRKPPGIK